MRDETGRLDQPVRCGRFAQSPFDEARAGEAAEVLLPFRDVDERRSRRPDDFDPLPCHAPVDMQVAAGDRPDAASSARRKERFSRLERDGRRRRRRVVGIIDEGRHVHEDQNRPVAALGERILQEVPLVPLFWPFAAEERRIETDDPPARSILQPPVVAEMPSP